MITASKPEIRSGAGKIEVTAAIDGHEFFVRWNGDQPPTEQAAGDAMACFALVPAMAQQRDLKIDAPVSPQLLYQLQEAQQMLMRWYPGRFAEVTIEASIGEDRQDRNPVAGTTFTSGMDSMFTLRTAVQKPRYAIYVHGFDIKLGDQQHRDLTSATCQAATREAGVDLVEVETNLRHYTDPHSNWLTEYLIAGIAGVGHLLSGQIGTLLVPASNSYEALPAIATDPLLDPLFSARHLEIVHHGCEAGRIDKGMALADWPVAQKYLRVCGKNVPGQLNCGRCEKCARTLLIFRIVGAYEQFVGNFADPADDESAVAIDVAPDPGKWFDWRGMYEVARQKPECAAIADAILGKLHEHENRQLTRDLRPQLNTVLESSHWQQRWPKFRNKLLRAMQESDPEWLQKRIAKKLPEIREALADELATDNEWLRKKIRRATWRRRLRRDG